MKLRLALSLLLLAILQLRHLPPPVTNSSCLFARCQPLCASCCPVLLYLIKALYRRIKNVFFFMFAMYYLCEEYYKPNKVQYYTANCVRWVPRLTNKLDLRTCSRKGTHSHEGPYCTDSAIPCLRVIHPTFQALQVSEPLHVLSSSSLNGRHPMFLPRVAARIGALRS